MIPDEILKIGLEALKWVPGHLPLVLGLAGLFLFRLALLTGTLLVMLRTQSLNYEFPPLLGSAALASACDMIPFVGHPLAVVVLTLCVLKMTQAHFIDVRFTVAISYAVMFLIKMLVLSSLPTPVMARVPVGKSLGAMLHPETDPADEQALAEFNPQAASKATNAPQDATLKTAATNQIPVTAASTNVPAGSGSVAARQDGKPVAPGEKSAEAIAKIFSLKGIVSHMAIIKAGTRTYTLQVGETAKVTTADQVVDFSLAEVSADGAVLNVGGTRVQLHLR